jgi:hypothetical protein
MVAVIKQIVTVDPDGVIRIRSPELRAGASADVTVLVELSPTERPLASFRGAAKGLYNSPDEVDRFIRSERDAWDR